MRNSSFSKAMCSMICKAEHKPGVTVDDFTAVLCEDGRSVLVQGIGSDGEAVGEIFQLADGEVFDEWYERKATFGFEIAYELGIALAQRLAEHRGEKPTQGSHLH